MVLIISLFLPILLAAVAVFVISSIIHTLLGYHNNDFKKLPNEDQIMNDLSKYNIPPNDYVMPYAADNKERSTDEFKQKMKKGPVAFVTMFPAGEINMGKSLFLWFLYSVIVNVFTAYITGRALDQGADFESVFRFAATASFMGYSLALLQNSIWYKKNWGATFKSFFDGLIYSLATGVIFAWLWP